jgi:hypothetical protein
LNNQPFFKHVGSSPTPLGELLVQSFIFEKWLVSNHGFLVFDAPYTVSADTFVSCLSSDTSKNQYILWGIKYNQIHHYLIDWFGKTPHF